MVDSGATQNYVADRIAHKLGLKLCQDGSSIKAVNSPARLISGIANNVPIRIGTWAGKATFMAIPMDDFQMILGMEFWRTALHRYRLWTRLLSWGSKPCLVATSKAAPSVEKDKTALVSAMQVKKGFRKGQPTFLATIKEESQGSTVTELPAEVSGLLKEFESVTPPELPKRLPPRRAVDHKIELESGAKPPAQAPYRMSVPELQELRKQLDELLSSGYIQVFFS